MTRQRTTKPIQTTTKSITVSPGNYGRLISDISGVLEQARRGAARSVNAILTATYGEIGRRIVEHELGGKATSEYGERLLERLSADLTARHGRGFSRSNVAHMRALSYLGDSPDTVWTIGSEGNLPDVVGRIGWQKSPDTVWTICNDADTVCAVGDLAGSVCQI